MRVARRARMRVETPIPIPALAPGDRSGSCGGEGGVGGLGGLWFVWGDASSDV